MTQDDGLLSAFWCANEVMPTDAKSLKVLGTSSAESTNTSKAIDSLRVATWNLLAPAYAKGLEHSEWRARLERQQAALDRDLDVIALQEFSVSHAPSMAAWDEWAKARDYRLFVLARTHGKADGCATLVKRGLVSGQAYGVHYDDWGDRVCLMVPLRDGIVACNTHWTFAHDNAWDPMMRYHQARKISSFIEATLPQGPVFLVGDLNGDIADPAVTKLAQSWTLHQPQGAWISHRAHTGAYLACDFVATRQIDTVSDVMVHGDKADLVPREPPDFRISDHNMVSATLIFSRNGHLDDHGDSETRVV